MVGRLVLVHDMKGTLYRIFHIVNGKSYIGKTYSCFYERLRQHIKDSKKFSNRPLYAAFNKYGIDSFSAEILGYFSEGILEEQECYYISKYNSYGKHGYNATLGGDGRRYLNIEDSKIIDSYLLHNSLFAASRDLKIDTNTIRKVLISNNIEIELKPKIGSIPVQILDVDLHFESLKDCARFLIDCELTTATDIRGIASHIKEVCSGTRRSYLGLEFKFI